MQKQEWRGKLARSRTRWLGQQQRPGLRATQEQLREAEDRAGSVTLPYLSVPPSPQASCLRASLLTEGHKALCFHLPNQAWMSAFLPPSWPVQKGEGITETRAHTRTHARTSPVPFILLQVSGLTALSKSTFLFSLMCPIFDSLSWEKEVYTPRI